MSKTVVEPDRPQMTIWRRVACWVIKATRASSTRQRLCTHTHPRTHTQTHKYVTHRFFTSTVVSWSRLVVTLYAHSLSCLVIWEILSNDLRIIAVNKYVTLRLKSMWHCVTKVVYYVILVVVTCVKWNPRTTGTQRTAQRGSIMCEVRRRKYR
jgi:SNF family Na+-dependent transporter